MTTDNENKGQLMLQAGRLDDARRAFWAEAEAAELRADVCALADAALGLGGIWVHEHRQVVERARVLQLQRRAVSLLDPAAPLAHRLRMRLLAEDAYLTQDGASVLAEHRANPDAGGGLGTAEGLSLAHHCMLGPDHGPTRLALAEELITAAVGAGSLVHCLQGLVWRTVDLFLLGDRHAERSLQELRERLASTPCDCLAFILTALDVMLLIRRGDLCAAEELAGVCYHMGVEAGDADALGFYGAHLAAIRWFQGSTDDLLPGFKELAHSTTLATPNEAVFAALAVLAVAADDLDTARSCVARLRSQGLASITRSSTWLATLFGVCHAAHALGDAGAAKEAYELLVPFADLPVMASLAIACFGSVHQPLGLAAWAMGEIEAAVYHLEAAIEADLSYPHFPSHAMDCALLAEVLGTRAGPGDDRRAVALLAGAVQAAQRYGMEAHARRWQAGVQHRAIPARVTIEREGPGWQLSVDDHMVMMPASVGMTYLATLVRRMGDEVACLELASGNALTLRGAGEPVLDAVAKAAYRREIQDLQCELEEAEADSDLDRAARARLELDRYLEELARATGFAGRSRTFDDDAERARVSVHKAIKRTLVQVEAADPLIGEEVRARVLTGMRCIFLHRRQPK
jgi:hypothetical protein